MGPSSSKRLSNTRGISKNTPGISVLTGRTRKNSRLEKRKDAPTLTTSPPTVTEEDPVENTTQADTNDTKDDGSLEYKVAESNKQVSGDNTNTTQMDDLSITNYGNNNNNAPYATESATSTSTSCSQHTRDSDHDAEVAATTSAARSTGVRIESPCELIDRRRSSSFSPASVASSLARPETPEVDNLRQRFESLGKSPILGATKRNSSITPEIASRIKDLKPKDPAGSRVKSMVEFFMDEKLHKWEF
ncbi:hypothetical protein BC941DRAFT_115496 [Chlamydoabsidia padenii]|nr:hypothetical protein BC941DRAFT_115496 [Chlamydoabsidia padenii]